MLRNHLSCKTANKYLNVCEPVEVIEWNKDVILSSPTAQYIVGVRQIKPRYKKKKIPTSNFNMLYVPYK